MQTSTAIILVIITLRNYHRLPAVSFNLPVEGPAIVVANHISGLDAFMLLASSSRPLHFLIAAEQYNRIGFRWLFDMSGCIPVEKTTRPDRALRAALRALGEGKVIALFPFGRMHLDSEAPIKIKGGVAVLAGRSGATIYPARIEGTAVKKEVMQAVIRRGHPKLYPLEPIRIENETPREMLSRLSEALSTPIEETT
jgi:1-acyl-sn-glycerol-3-phosphate acyltransferase